MRTQAMVAVAALTVIAACSRTEEKRPAPPAPAKPVVAGAPTPTPPTVRPAMTHVDPTALTFSRDETTCYGVVPYRPLEFASEAEAIKATGGAERNGGVLKVGGVTFETKPFETHEADGAEYAYLGRLAQSSMQVVLGRFYEWETWTLVDPANGAHVEMSVEPVPSPAGDAFAGVSDDIMGLTFNGIEIVDYRDGRFRSQSFEGGTPCDLRWKSPDELEVKVLPGNPEFDPGDEPPASAWKLVRIVRDGDGWRMLEPSA